jgi:hypothetical protein
MAAGDGADHKGVTQDPLLPLLAEVVDAAREVALTDQPPRLRNALAALALTESRVVTAFLEADSD